MKRSTNKSAASTGKIKQPPSELTTGLNSQQRSQIHSLIRPRERPNPHSAVKAKQLFSIIQTFYSTLCDLPLEKLISSAEPETWIEEQEETLRSLEGRLRGMGKEKEQEYYRCKLRSIGTILGNIRDNLAMLKRMSELKNYCSGTESSNYQSHRGSSFDNSSKHIKLGQFASDSGSIRQIKEMLNYDQYPLQGSCLPKSTTSGCPEMMAQTVNSQIESSEEEESLAKSEMFSKKKGKKRCMPREGENCNTSNRVKNMNQSEKFQELKDKTLAKIQASSKSHITINNTTTENRYRGFHLSNEQTKRSEVIQGNSSTFSQSVPAEYLELIKELRLQLLQKDREIQRLLINQQEFDQTVEIYQNRQKQKATQILFLKENAAIHEREREKMQAEIRRLTAEAEELKDSVRLERERSRKEEAERAKTEQSLQMRLEEKEALQCQMNELREQCQTSRKNERKLKESLDIYTRKYFELLAESESQKEEMRSLAEQACRERERNRADQVCESLKRILDRHKQKIFLQSC